MKINHCFFHRLTASRGQCSRAAGLLPILWLLAACASTPAPRAVSAPVAAQWHAPLPVSSAAPVAHQGSLTDLSRWWQQQGDELLAELIAAGQAVSPTVASARSRIEQARATRVGAGADLLPSLDAAASVSRGPAQSGGPGAAPVVTTSQIGLQSAWEIDVFGGRLASRNAATERLEGAQAQWHDARVSVAAEVANQYYGLRSCEGQLDVTRADAASRTETARLTDLSMRAGFTAPATAALARASAAEASARATQQAAQCELDTKALVALTGLQEPNLKQKMALAQSIRAEAATISISNVPADALAQRPDVFNAQREVAAASDELGSAQAERYPRLSLSGSIGKSQLRAGGVTTTFDTWSVGPLTLSLPLFDGGRRAANVDAAQARYEEAAAVYRGRVRQAVREVEEALVNLQSTADRSGATQTAVDGYRASFTGTQALYQAGLASLVELEDARRTLLAAQTSAVTLQRDQRLASVALYLAMGGGWSLQLGGPADPAQAARR